MSAEDLDEEILALMHRAGIRPELILASLRTGLIVTKENLDFISPHDREAWFQAIDEYRAAERGTRR